MGTDAGRIRAAGRTGWRRRARMWGLPILMLLCATLPHLDDGDWMRTDSAWYGAIGLQAWRTGEFVSLGAGPGELYFNKPPLVFWIIGLPMHAFGPSAWTARLPTVLAAAGCVALTVSIARQGMSRRAAMWAGIVLALTYEFFRRTREISLDMWQAMFLLAALRLVVGAIVSGRARWVVLAGVPLGLALMCKPLVGLGAVPILGVTLVCARRWRLIPWIVPMLAVTALVATPWHVAMAQIHGDVFVGQYFGAEIADRAAGGANTNERALGRWWFYLEKIVEGYWPWLLPTMMLGLAVFRRRWRFGDARVISACALWTVAWIVLLSIFPDRRDRYGLVFYPALAVLPAAWLVYRGRGVVAGATRVVERHGVWFMPLAATVFALLPVRVQRRPDPQWPGLYEFLREQGDPEVWQGAIIGHRGSRLYLQTGRWPVGTRNMQGEIVARPPGGALILYHADDAGKPGPGERVVFTSGALTVTRLEGGAEWQPRE